MKREMLMCVLPMALAMGMTGCVSSQKISHSHSLQLPKNTTLSIRQPADGVYDGETEANSGATVARRLQAALIRHFPATEIAEKTSGYVIKPSILHWEDRATEWSGKPDRISISIQAYNPSGTLLDTAMIEAKSSWWTLGGDHPEDLLKKPFEEYALKLSGAAVPRR